MKGTNLHLFLGDQQTTAVSAVDTSTGIPRQRFRRRIIRTGNYIKDKQRFSVDRGLLLHWSEQFRKMARNGIEVPIPIGHTMSAEANRGYVKDMMVEDDALVAIFEMIGQEGIDLVQRNGVSIYSPTQWTDGKGNQYERPILHVALTSYPVIPGLGDAEAIAASFQEDMTMAIDWKKIKELLKHDADLDDSNGEEALVNAITARDKAIGELTGRLTDGQKKIADLTLANDKSVEELKELKLSNEPKKVDKQLVKISGELRTAKIDGLVAAGNISPAVATELKKTFTEGAGLELSLARDDETFDRVLAALAKNTVVEMKERSGAQLLELSNTAAGTASKHVIADAENRAKMNVSGPRW